MMKPALVAVLLAALSAGAVVAAVPPPGTPEYLALREHGRVIYTAHCARCHGADGGDTSYPGVKTLVDITRHRPGGEILETSRAFATADLSGTSGTALLLFLATLNSDGYPEPDLLVETSWVAMHLQDPALRLLDLRSAAAYAAGHLPGAAHVEEGPLRNAEDPQLYLPPAARFAELMSALGVGPDTHVVLYDDQSSRSAARLWFVLNAFGHARVSILNGGWKKWAAEQRPVSREAPTPRPARFAPRAVPALSCPAPELLARRPGTVVLDARSPEEYRGEMVSSGAVQAGRIPGAVNVDWRENVTGPFGVFRPAAELRQLYASRGITPDKEIVTYCASGGRAAHSLFTLKLLGYPRVRVYYGSFADYSRRPEAPVEK